ncbi:phage portal protein [Dermabacteraceae bacterium P13138]|nr:phage portal protein [Dermabacteraceae bacterium TAE3-ERU27]
MSLAGDLIAGMLSVGASATAVSEFEGIPVEVSMHDLRPGGQDGIASMPPEEVWRTQPHLRTVVDFKAGNIARLGVQVIRKNGDQRERERGPVERVLARPNPYMTGTELIYDLVACRALYGEAFWLIMPGGENGVSIHPVPPRWVSLLPQKGWADKPRYRIAPPFTSKTIEVDADMLIAFPTWKASPGAKASAPLDALRGILQEQASARKHRTQLWKRNGRIGGYVTRPADAPPWDDTARRRFAAMLEAFTGDKGPRAGGMPLLEDGMDLKRSTFSSADEQWLESAKLSLEVVAQTYQIAPAMIGGSDGVTFSNMREYSRALYKSSLGPEIVLIENRLTHFVLPALSAEENLVVKLNVEADLRGSFEEQAKVMSSAIGGPWMTRNEGRALQDIPPIDGGDELIVPLNVVEGGQASPRDGGDGRPPE